MAACDGWFNLVLTHLLEKMQSPDKDYRFMAVNDFMTQLQKDTIKLDDDSERKVVRMLLKLLEDKNAEVQNLAVKCLGLLIKRVEERRVEVIVEILCEKIVSQKEQLYDIATIGLRTVISEYPLTSNLFTKKICERIIEHLILAIKMEYTTVQLDALDILVDLLTKFGSILKPQNMSFILCALLPELRSARQAVRKRTVTACSILVSFCDNLVYKEIVDHLYTGLTVNFTAVEGRTFVQCLASICLQSGVRFGEHIERFFPIILQYSYEDDDDTREHCLQAFKVFIQQCPKEITLHIQTITDLCLKYLTYDPNYIYGHNSEEGIEEEMSEETDEDTDEYSDDDDLSWKVRRASAKCLESIISSRPELLTKFYQILSPALIAGFKEREEKVKSDIIRAYIALLKQTKLFSSATTESETAGQNEAPEYLLAQQVPLIIREVRKHLKNKSTQTRQDCFNLLTVLCTVQPGALSDHMGDLLPRIHYSLEEKSSSSTTKFDALSFMHCMLTSHPPEVFHSHIGVMLPPIIGAAASDYYKVSAKALLILQDVVKIIRPLDSSLGFEYRNFTNDIYNCTLERLKLPGIDQEVKEQAIVTMGQVISNFGDFLSAELPICMPIFFDRLKNEMYRLTTIKALSSIITSPLCVNLIIVNEAIPILGSFLRKNQRTLKLSTLQLLNCLTRKHYNNINVDLLQHVIVELPPLVDESDLHLAQWTFVLLESIAHYHGSALQNIPTNVLPEIMKLLKSPLLQGTVLHAVLQFFKSLVKCRLPGMQYNDLLQMFSYPISHTNKEGEDDLHKQAYCSLAKCIGAITAVCDNQVREVVNQFAYNIRLAKNDSQQIFCLLVFAEIGREINLQSIVLIDDIIQWFWSSESEEVKFAASYALGSISIGNLQESLPFILEEIETQPAIRYLLLNSLKEVIISLSSSDGIQQLLPFIPEIWQQLLSHCKSVDGGTRNIVSECLGKLTLTDPSNLLPNLQKQLKETDPLVRVTVVGAINYIITDQSDAIDPLLCQCIDQFLNAMQDPDLNVRRDAFLMFNSAVHNKPALVRDLLGSLQPYLYDATKIKEELIKEVEMGPFKHRKDEGLDVRKAAFECMYTLLDSCLDKLDIFEFLSRIEDGLKDHSDIQMLTYLIVTRLVQLCPEAVLQEIDKLVEPLYTTCVMKVKGDSIQQEYDKNSELKKSAMRVILALLTIPNADKKLSLVGLVEYIKSSLELRTLYSSIQYP